MNNKGLIIKKKNIKCLFRHWRNYYGFFQNRQVVKLVLQIVLFGICLNIPCRSQTLSESIAIADSLFKEREYEASIKIYKRAIFFSHDKAELYKKTAEAYMADHEYKIACSYYDSAIFTNPEIVSNKLIFANVDCLIMEEDYEKALTYIEKINTFRNFEVYREVMIYKGIIYFSMNAYKESEVMFLSAIPDSLTDLKDNIKEIFAKKNKYKSPNPNFAGFMSLLLPGSGQTYTGNYKDGVNSAVLLGALLAVAYDMGARYSVIDPIISISPWFLRYYKGGYLNSKDIAKKKLNQKRSTTLKQILSVIDSI